MGMTLDIKLKQHILLIIDMEKGIKLVAQEISHKTTNTHMLHKYGHPLGGPKEVQKSLTLCCHIAIVCFKFIYGGLI